MAVALRKSDQLFGDFKRSDRNPARYRESSYEFLNRVDQPYWQRVRELLENWFSEFPASERADLGARFRKDDPNQHWPAWWELYLHALFLRLGFEVEVHPDLGQRPDFLLSKNGEPSIYVEAVCANTGAISAPERHSAREGRIIDMINEIPHRGFHVSIDFDATGPRDLKKRFVQKTVLQWLDDAGASHESNALRIFRDGWNIRLAALTAGRRTEARLLISFGPGIVGMADDIGQLRSVAARKHRRYEVGDLPLALAILQKNDPWDEDGIDRLLYGDRLNGGSRTANGLWSAKSREGRFRPDAAIVGTSVHPWTVGNGLPIYLAPHEPGIDLPEIGLPAASNDLESFSPRELFRLAPEWPGPESPFEGL